MQVMKTMDADGNGCIDYREFIAASLSLYQVSRHQLPSERALWQSRLQVLFNELDVDNDGRITHDELKSIMPDNKEVQKAMQVCIGSVFARTWSLYLCASIA
jgi:Ca2+-binding EF-hand superfamily protein